MLGRHTEQTNTASIDDIVPRYVRKKPAWCYGRRLVTRRIVKRLGPSVAFYALYLMQGLTPTGVSDCCPFPKMILRPELIAYFSRQQINCWRFRSLGE